MFHAQIAQRAFNTPLRNRSKTAGNMVRYAFVALCLLFAQTWQRWRTIWARCGTGWAPLMFNLSPR